MISLGSPIRGRISPTSPDVTASAKYIGWYPMTQWTGAVGALAGDSITLSTAGVDTGNDWITGATAATWLVAGTPIRVRNTGTIPPGLSSSTTYYAGKPDADKLSFHLTAEAAIAGTGKVNITGAGTSNVIIYPGVVEDKSGNSNHMEFGANINNVNIWTEAPYLTGASSGSADTALARLAVATLNARWAWPTHSLVAFFRVKVITALTVGRSIWGNGVSTSVHGPAIALDSTTGAHARIIFCGGTTAITVGDTAASPFVLNEEHSIGVAFDGPSQQATAWVDGERDLSIDRISLASAGTVLPTTDLRIGGRAATNAQAASFRDYHLLSLLGSLPSNMDAIMARLHTSLYSRLRSVDL